MSITRVQAQSGSANGAALTLTAPSNFTSGNLIVFSMSVWYEPPSAVTIGGLAATGPVISRNAGGNDYAQQYYVVASGSITGATATVTPAGGDFYVGSVVEYSSTTGWPANPVTSSGATPASATGTGTAPSATLTTTAADCVIVSNWSNSADSFGDNGTVPSGYTRDYTAAGGEGGAGASRIVTSAGAQTPVHTAGGSIPWACVIAAYAANTGGGGSTIDVDGGTDTPAVSDSASRGAEFGRSGADTVAITDAITITIQGLTDLSVSDSAAVSDSLSVVLFRVLAVSISDTLEVSDALEWDLYSPADAISTSDSTTRGAEFGRSGADTVAVSDSVTAEIVTPSVIDVSASDSVTTSDALALEVQYGRAGADTFSTSDSTTIGIEYGRAGADTAATSDTGITSLEFGRSLSDSVSTADSLATATAYARTLSDSITVADDTEVQVTSPSTLDVQVSDSLSCTDALGNEAQYFRTVQDTLTASDVASVGLEVVRTFSDTLGAGDSLALTIEYARLPSDSISTSDTLVTETAYVRALADSFATSDDVAVELIAPFISVSVSDTLAITDSVSAVRDGAIFLDHVGRTIHVTAQDRAVSVGSRNRAVKVTPYDS